MVKRSSFGVRALCLETQFFPLEVIEIVCFRFFIWNIKKKIILFHRHCVYVK
jgi:hypothetical protein